MDHQQSENQHNYLLSEDELSALLKFGERFRLKQKPTKAKTILSIGGIPVLREGGVLVIKGRKKSRKTTLAAELMRCSGLRVGFFDFEQIPEDSWDNVRSRIQCDGVFNFKVLDRSQGKQMLLAYAQSKQFDVIIVDNASYLVQDINSSSESEDIKTFLQRISELTPLVVVAHTNRSNSNASGHIGHALEKIAETIIIVRAINKNRPELGSIVECDESRRLRFPRMKITHEGGLELAGKEVVIEDDEENPAEKLFKGKEILLYSELRCAIMDAEEIKEKTAEKRITQYLEKELIVKLEDGKGYQLAD